MKEKEITIVRHQQLGLELIDALAENFKDNYIRTRICKKCKHICRNWRYQSDELMMKAEEKDNKVPISVMHKECLHFKCPICLRWHSKFADYVITLHCGHMMHRNCARHCAKADMSYIHTLPRCPECSANGKITLITEQQIASLADDKLTQMYNKLIIERKYQGKINIFQCPTPDCLQLAELSKDTNRFNCNSCGSSYCTKCQRHYHPNESCDEYGKRECKDEIENEQKLKELARKNGWKSCPNCGTMIERVYGCFHMKCPNPSCQTHYCDMCGKGLDPKHWKRHFNPPNQCRLWRNENDLLNEKGKHEVLNICWLCFRNGECPEPQTRLSCGHYYHLTCLWNKIEKGCQTNRISFDFLNCGICNREMQDRKSVV